MQQLWVKIDAGKTHHHAVVIDCDATRLLSRRVLNDEAVLRTLIDDVLGIADGGDVVWAVDLNSGGAALLKAMLAANRQALKYIPGRIVHHAAGGYRGDGKTDAKDAAIIADQARIRRDLQPMRVDDEVLPRHTRDMPWRARHYRNKSLGGPRPAGLLLGDCDVKAHAVCLHRQRGNEQFDQT